MMIYMCTHPFPYGNNYSQPEKYQTFAFYWFLWLPNYISSYWVVLFIVFTCCGCAFSLRKCSEKCIQNLVFSDTVKGQCSHTLLHFSHKVFIKFVLEKGTLFFRQHEFTKKQFLFT